MPIYTFKFETEDEAHYMGKFFILVYDVTGYYITRNNNGTWELNVASNRKLELPEM